MPVPGISPLQRRYLLALSLLFAAQLGIVAAVLLLAGLDMDAAQRAAFHQALGQQAGMLAVSAFLLLLLLALALKRVFDRWLAPLAMLAEETALLQSNPAHRSVIDGAPPVRELAGRFNALAAQMQAMRQENREGIDGALRSLAQERNRLAALMADLALGVVMCNLEGRILLYNSHASALLDVGGGAAPGLGRSVFGLIERGLIVHALEQLQHGLQARPDGEAAPVLHALPRAAFVAGMPDGRMMRMQIAPVLDDAQALSGFVLTVDDISRQAQAQDRDAALLDRLLRQARAGVANIRAAAETLAAYADMSPQRRQRFIAAIEEESQALAAAIGQATREREDETTRSWHLEEMRGDDLLALLQRRLEGRSLRLSVQSLCEPAPWLQVDSYALAQALARLGEHILRECDAGALALQLDAEGRLAWLAFIWHGLTPAPALLRQWEEEAPDGGASLQAVAQRHGGDTVLLHQDGMLHWRLLLPALPAGSALPLPRPKPSRPEFYDFDLFSQAGQSAELDARPLSRLSCTVFDTETTGLDPGGGDDIIAIGALRIVNGRLLRQEQFERLVRPRRPVSPASFAVHGISDDMLRHQPGGAEVLAQFHRFVEDTVLVAHNAAFDLRFLRMREAEAGVTFDQPVLDTLLLSQALHPNQAEHSLEAIAARLGVAVIGRHTALGDAIVTAEVFLRMLPLLAEAGIATLGQAREAARHTRYAQLRY
ncbi:MAG: exonuclease domain-containing protein [Burkholderiaceae bacterium]